MEPLKKDTSLRQGMLPKSLTERFHRILLDIHVAAQHPTHFAFYTHCKLYTVTTPEMLLPTTTSKPHPHRRPSHL